MGITDTIKKGIGSLKPPKSFDELEEEEERADVELSIAQKRLAKKELEARGNSLNNFRDKKRGGISWSGVINWLRSH